MLSSAQATLIGVGISILVHALLAVWYYGRMSARVDNHGGWIKRVDEDVADLRVGFNDHGERISRLEGAASAGAHKHGHA